MKHLKDAQNLINLGDSSGALEIIENILSLSPRNTEALRIKAHILDSRGFFDESFALLQLIARISPSDEHIEDIEKRMEEERESLIYSRLTHEGRWYFQFSALQITISLVGLIGCIFFLISSPTYLNTPFASFWLLFSFLSFVLLPWLTLIFLNLRGVKKILVGFSGIHVFYGLKKINYSWEQIGAVVIEYDVNLNLDHLQMIIYSKTDKKPLLNLDISKKSSVVRARRHFVRLVLSYIDSVSYIQRGYQAKNNEEISDSTHNSNKTAA